MADRYAQPFVRQMSLLYRTSGGFSFAPRSRPRSPLPTGR